MMSYKYDITVQHSKKGTVQIQTRLTRRLLGVYVVFVKHFAFCENNKIYIKPLNNN